MFTDSYGEQSCTAGRSSFITGQSVYRTGLSKVGIPAAPVGMSDKLVTIAALLKEQRLRPGSAQEPLGDLNHMLPTETRLRRSSSGNLYHLKRRGRAGDGNYPSRGLPGFREKFGRAA
jgi:arylsulfatase